MTGWAALAGSRKQILRTLVLSGDAPAPPDPGPEPGEWVPPTSAEWTALQNALTSAGASGLVIVSEATGLRVDQNGEPGVSLTNPVGGAPNWLAPEQIANGGVAAGAQRPTYATVDGLAALNFSGDTSTPENQRLAIPHVNSSSGYACMAVRLNANTNRGDGDSIGDMLLQTAPLRVLARRNGANPVPGVRVASNVHYNFTSGSFASTWAMFEVEWDTIANALRIRRNAQQWQAFSGVSWMTNSASLIARHTYQDGGFNGEAGRVALWRMVVSDKKLSETEYAAARAFVIAGTSINDNVGQPTEPGPGDEPGSQEETTVSVASYADLASACAAAAAGTTIQLVGGTYSGSKITVPANGTAANPIVIRAATIGAANVPGGFRLTGSHIVLRGLDFDANTAGTDRVELGGESNQIWRCSFKFAGGQNNLKFYTGQNGRAMFCTFETYGDDSVANSRSLGAYVDADIVHPNAEVGYCYFLGLPSKPVGQDYSFRSRSAIGLSHNHTRSLMSSRWKIHHCLFENCGNSRLNIKTSDNEIEFCTISGRNGNNDLTYSTDFNQRFGKNNIWRGCWSKSADGYRVQGEGHKYISCVSTGSFGGCDYAPGDHDAPPVAPGNPRADRGKFTACDFPLRIGGMSWAGNLPARDARVEAHQGSVSYSSTKHTGTVIVGTTSEPTVTPIEILASQVGQNGTGL